MTTDTFISTQEAGELIGVNKKTVKRRADNYLKSNNLALDTASHLIEARDNGGGRKKYYVSKEFVLKHLVGQGIPPSGTSSKDDAFATRQLLQQLETKDLQIKTKDDQLAAKDEQIVNLGERLRESHFLLKEEQKLHAQVLERKRPLLSFRTKRDETNVVQEDGSQPNVIQEEGSRPSRVWRIAAAAGIGFSVLAVLAAAIFYFV